MIPSEYILFPLQFHPEASTSVLAFYCDDELNLLRKICLSFQKNMTIVVKEHPAAFGFRSSEFYKELQKYQNLELVHPSFDIFELILKSKAVVSITSTVAYQAALLGKRVFLLGDTYFEELPNIRKVSDTASIDLEDNLISSDKETLECLNRLMSRTHRIGFDYNNFQHDYLATADAIFVELQYRA